MRAELRLVLSGNSRGGSGAESPSQSFEAFEYLVERRRETLVSQRRIRRGHRAEVFAVGDRSTARCHTPRVSRVRDPRPGAIHPVRRKSRMVAISLSGSGEGPGRVTGRGYSTQGWRGAVGRHRCRSRRRPVRRSGPSTGQLHRSRSARRTGAVGAPPASARTGAGGSLWDAPSRWIHAGDPERQRPHLPESPLPSGVPGLQAPAGVHDALYARAERFDREVLPQSERGVHLADELPEFPGGEASRGAVDRVVQHLSPPPGPRLPEPT